MENRYTDKEGSAQPLGLPEPASYSQVPAPSRRWRKLTILVGCFLAWHVVVGPISSKFRSMVEDSHPPRPPTRKPMDTAEREALFLSIPNAESALNASKVFTMHPHIAGSEQDFEDAKSMLSIFESGLGIHRRHCPHTGRSELPVFPAGSKHSRHATLGLTERGLPGIPRRPTAWIDVYYPVLNTPLSGALEIIGADGEAEWAADLSENADPLDETAHKYSDTIKAWHGLSKDGDVQGQLVYANYGTQEDYKELVAQGVDFKDKIVLVRYNQIFRGLKIKGAEELGAAGVLIFSDPHDDGSVTVANGYKAYPYGPARNPDSVQRGSVQYLSMYPGDPTTPGFPSYENATRTDGLNIPNIPSLPISWNNAQRLFKEINSSASDTLPLDGKVSEKKIRLVNHVDTKVTPIWNTMASIPGHIRNEVVVIGNHRDAWVMGAADPSSGTSAMSEIVRGFGELLKQGWQPLRTIVFASWDAEEYGLIGSTEWGEDFSDWVSEHVVAYLNVDVAASGSHFKAAGSPSLAHLIRKTAQDIDHPTDAGRTLWDARTDKGPYAPADQSEEEEEADLASSSLGVSPLGSGSDYTVFLQRIGVASIDTGFSSTYQDAVYHYHSVYDTQRYQELYADPGFHRHVAISKFLGLLALRISDTPILSLNTTHYALELDSYLDIVEEIAATTELENKEFPKLRKSIHKLQKATRALDEEAAEALEKLEKLVSKLPGRRSAHGGCRRGFLGKAKYWMRNVFGTKHDHSSLHTEEMEEVYGYIKHAMGLHGKSFHPHHAMMHHHKHLHAHKQLEEAASSDHSKTHHAFPIWKIIKAAKRLGRANKKIAAFEEGFISEGGIKDREWYKHLGVAPGKWLGYGATTFPALTEALTIENNSTQAEYEAQRLTTLIERLMETIKV